VRLASRAGVNPRRDKLAERNVRAYIRILLNMSKKLIYPTINLPIGVHGSFAYWSKVKGICARQMRGVRPDTYLNRV
jgi:hypothetical protein